MDVATSVAKLFTKLGQPEHSIAGPHNWLYAWEKVHYLPSRHDLHEWGSHAMLEDELEDEKRSMPTKRADSPQDPSIS